MSRPVIGFTVDCAGEHAEKYQVNADYASAIEKAGGLPLAIPFRTDISLVGEIVEALDGILFIGGDDLNPEPYGETWHPRACRLNADRERFEYALLAEVERQRLPAMGICLGSQLMNVHRGGTLHQFLPEVPRTNALEHRRLDLSSRAHKVAIIEDTIIGRAIGQREIEVNTSHKQAVRTLGRSLRIAATAPDGVIEAFEDPDLPLYIAIQWHPERLCDHREHLALFQRLVEGAAGCR